MRGKKAKAIRRIAHLLTNVGAPERDYVEGRKNVVLVPGYDATGKPVKVPFVYTGTIRLTKDCARGVYKRVKRRLAA